MIPGITENAEVENAVVGNGVIGAIHSLSIRGSTDKQKAVSALAPSMLSERARLKRARLKLNSPWREIEMATLQGLVAQSGREAFPNVATQPPLPLSIIVQGMEPESEGNNIALEGPDAEPGEGDPRPDWLRRPSFKHQKNGHQGLRLTDEQALLLGTQARQEEC